VKVAVLAEFYPSRRDPVLGIWCHRQVLAAREAGADVRVLVLHRLVPPRSSLAAGPARALGELTGLMREPRRQLRDGIEVEYVPYVSPPRARSYPAWGAWAAPVLGLALARLRRSSSYTHTTPCRPATQPSARSAEREACAYRSSSPCTAATCSTP
jgi:teichuronic acid biosynthesis glycosyltransferase TuaC